jgi:hypothetical protein
MPSNIPHATWSKIQRRRQHHSLITIHAIITLHYTHLSPLTITGLQLSCGSIHRTCACGFCNCMKRPTCGSLKKELDQKSAPRLATLIFKAPLNCYICWKSCGHMHVLVGLSHSMMSHSMMLVSVESSQGET